MTLQEKYTAYLSKAGAPLKIPFIKTVEDLSEAIPVTDDATAVPGVSLPQYPSMDVLRAINIKVNKKNLEKMIQIYQRALPISSYGRLRGNMNYTEDCWDIQIQPPSIRYAYLKNGSLALSENKQMRIRDKYIKIKIRYDGTQYVVVNAIKTYYTVSYA